MPDEQGKSDPRRARDRIILCVWPTERGACRKTIDQLEREGFDTSRGGLVALQEHCRDAHLYPDGTYREARDWDDWNRTIRAGSGLPVSSVGLNARQDPLYGAYTYSLGDGLIWMFAGTREQAELWIKTHSTALHTTPPERTPRTHAPLRPRPR